MSHTDPIADMLTRIRNANCIKREKVEVFNSKTNYGIAEVLKREGFINDFEITPYKNQGKIVIALKYGPDGELVINQIKRESKPGCRVYKASGEIEKVLGGRGVAIVSTSKGILSDRECREVHAGGEFLCTVW
ncbi:MAG: 30S ribosomal protein S8 [Planctomycetota bacterium]